MPKATDERQSPPVPLELLEWLVQTFPNQCASADDTDREIWMKSGEQRLIARLRFEHNQLFKEKED